MAGMTRAKSGALVADWKPPESAGGHNATICDMGGGVGAFLAEWLRHHPHARGVLLELPAHVPRAAAFFASRGVAGRASVVGHNFLEPLPEKVGDVCDVYFVKNCLHNWPDEQAALILSHIREGAKKKHAVLAVAEVVLDAGTPASGRTFKYLMDVQMAAVMPAGARERTMADFKKLFQAAGLPAPPERVPLRDINSLLITTLHPA